MKWVKKAISLSIGICIFIYLALSIKNNYGWTEFGAGFGSLLILLPIAVILGASCLIFPFILARLVENKKIISVLNVLLVVIPFSWLIFLNVLSLRIEDEHYGKPRGVLLDNKTRLGELQPDTKWVELDHTIYYISEDKSFYPSALCSINIKGNNRRMLVENCRKFGFLPNGDIFAYSGNFLYRLTIPDVNKKVIPFIPYDEYIRKNNLYSLKVNEILRSPRDYSVEFKPKNDIALKIERYGNSLYIQKGNQPSKKIFEYIGSTGYDVGYRPAVYDFFWLPGDRYIICSIKYYLCIIDTKDERIGILTQGYTPAWYNMEN